MACSWVGVFQTDITGKDTDQGFFELQHVRAQARLNESFGQAQKYIAVFNSQSNWQPLWKINFYNGIAR
jgi:hypothetical protein